MPLTSDQRPLAFLPSDFAQAMAQPPGTPTEASFKSQPDKPTTAIPELNVIELTPFAYQCVIEAIDAADKVQIEKMNPTGAPTFGTGLRSPPRFWHMSWNMPTKRRWQTVATQKISQIWR